MSTPPDDPGASSGRPMRMEIGAVLLIVLILLVGGGLYVLVAGSPTKNRQTIDSPNTLPGTINYPARPPANATAPAKPATP